MARKLNEMENWELYKLAEARVSKSPRLRKYSDILLYEWPDTKNHLIWVIKAPVKELIQWADYVEYTTPRPYDDENEE